MENGECIIQDLKYCMSPWFIYTDIQRHQVSNETR